MMGVFGEPPKQPTVEASEHAARLTAQNIDRGVVVHRHCAQPQAVATEIVPADIGRSRRLIGRFGDELPFAPGIVAIGIAEVPYGAAQQLFQALFGADDFLPARFVGAVDQYRGLEVASGNCRIRKLYPRDLVWFI